MNAKQFEQKLIKLDACSKARKWAKGKTWEEAYTQCHRGDWLAWLFKRTHPDDLRALTHVKGYQANTVRHLMNDERSLKAVDTAIAFGEGRATREELEDSAYAAYAAYAAADADADAAAAAAAAAADAAAYAAYDAARAENQRLTADIARKYLPIEIWNI